MHFCDHCLTQFNITKDVDSKMIGGAIYNQLEIVFQKFFDGLQLEPEDLEGITIENIYHDSRHENMTKKDKTRLKTWLRTVDKAFVQDSQEGGEAKAAYFICKFCSNYREIEPGTLIFGQNYKSSSDSAEISDLEVNDNTLSRTKAYICPNGTCETNKDKSKREAVLTRDAAGHVVYICMACNTQWSQSV